MLQLFLIPYGKSGHDSSEKDTLFLEEQMARKNRYYPPEFKREALAMLATGEYTMAQLERELGITSGLIKQWKRKAERNGGYVSPMSEPATPRPAHCIRSGDFSRNCAAHSTRNLKESLLCTIARI